MNKKSCVPDKNHSSRHRRLTNQAFGKDNGIPVKRSLLPSAAALAFRTLFQCVHKPVFPEYTPLCSRMTVTAQPVRPVIHQQESRHYRAGPKGGAYYINSHHKKVYIKKNQQVYFLLAKAEAAM